MLEVKIEHLESLIDTVGLSRNEVAQALGVTRSTLWRWLSTGEIPERAYVFLKIVRFHEGELGLREVTFQPARFKDSTLKAYAAELKEEFKELLYAQLGEVISVDLSTVDTAELIDELKRRNPEDQVIIAKVKSLS